ncbi:3-hydroxyphenylacetate 6-hydroxylase [Tolypocladium ophioglossoides CBS 100239]|uniref:3-hydroxyphenylacetate 6-hydroxylase n=1 Tax=Tolypocladium ophioglossoides (strain CBS 100239) TaxID=1163406 RepID=A0A0L0MZL4_TOLOC|nr:3-hydroxyphenylacetate 6-hydroxylase [Tolypocladium ophioglossoides CBS 100239]
MPIAALLLSLNDQLLKNIGRYLLLTLVAAPLVYDIRVNAAKKYREWARKFGDVYQVQLGSVPVAVVNSAAAAKVIFGQNAQAMSSRPQFYTVHKACHALLVLSNTAGTTISTSPYSDSLKRRRKGAASALNKSSVQTYISHLDTESRDFVKELHVYGEAGEGIHLESQKEDLFYEITHDEEEISRFRSTTGNLQDYIPLLRLNPINLHSAKAREMRNRRDTYLSALNNGLDEQAKLDKAELTSISLTMLSGGLDTITTQVAWFLAFLSQNPQIQEKAVSEIRMFYDESQPMCDPLDDFKCEYVAALVRESLRYFTVLRLTLPRSSTKSIMYGGLAIPKDSVVF